MVSLVCSVFLTGTYILPNDSRYGGADTICRHCNNAVYLVSDTICTCCNKSVSINIFSHKKETKLHSASADCCWKSDFYNRTHLAFIKLKSSEIYSDKLFRSCKYNKCNHCTWDFGNESCKSSTTNTPFENHKE